MRWSVDFTTGEYGTVLALPKQLDPIDTVIVLDFAR